MPTTAGEVNNAAESHTCYRAADQRVLNAKAIVTGICREEGPLLSVSPYAKICQAERYNPAVNPSLLNQARWSMALLYYDPVFLEHQTGEHPERPQRLISIIRKLDDGLLANCK